LSTKTVLVWGLPEDAPTARVADQLVRMNVPVAWVNQQEIRSHSIELELSGDVRGTLHLARGRVLDLAEIGAAYLRPYDFRTLEAVRALEADDIGLRRCAAFEEMLQAWAEMTSATVINRFSAMTSNGSKPYQAEIIRQFGFAVPETLITSDPDAARVFWERHGSVVYKSISGQRSVVARLRDADRHRLQRVARCPTQFQQWVPGIDYRAHVVGDSVLSCRIRSTAVDYRYDRGTLVEAVELPDSVAERCYRLTRALGLELGGVDLRETPDGEWFCFEVNSSPGFTYYEDATGLPIGAAVASVLASFEAGHDSPGRWSEDFARRPGALIGSATTPS
jgi:glutathione synthase/RimK-type ligase-like ATP-grasp enzyme